MGGESGSMADSGYSYDSTPFLPYLTLPNISYGTGTELYSSGYLNVLQQTKSTRGKWEKRRDKYGVD